MNAKEARLIALEVMRLKSDENYIKLKELIKINADLGKLQTYYYGLLDDTSLEFLKKEGYVINLKEMSENSYEYLIKW